MFAVILSLCTYASCNGYFVSSGTTMAECQTNLVVQADRMANVWNNDKALTEFLAEFNIVEPIKMIQDYDYTCEFIPDAQIP